MYTIKVGINLTLFAGNVIWNCNFGTSPAEKLAVINDVMISFDVSVPYMCHFNFYIKLCFKITNEKRSKRDDG